MLGGYGDFMFQTGMIDEYQKQYVIEQTDAGVKFIQQQKWVEAFRVRDAACLFNLSKEQVGVIYRNFRFKVIPNSSKDE